EPKHMAMHANLPLGGIVMILRTRRGTRPHSIITNEWTIKVHPFPRGVDETNRLRSDQSPATAGSGRARAVRSALTSSGRRKARSIDCSALSRGSQTV